MVKALHGFFSCLFFMFLALASAGQGPESYISLHLKNQTYQNGKLVELESDYYFDKQNGELIVHGDLPKEFIKKSNKFGEVQIYFPGNNTVSVKQSVLYSSQNELLYYFLSNNFSDLGLSKEGYSIVGTKMDGQYQVVSWQASQPNSPLPKIDLVFENDQPVYAAYFNAQNQVSRKIYYYNYEYFQTFMMPTKVTQITYPVAGDSIVQRNTYSDFKITSLPSSQYFNFKVPEDARILE